MSFISILFKEQSDQTCALQAVIPLYFIDLNLDQIIDAVTVNWEEYDLKKYFYYPLRKIDSITYRHEVFRDLENEKLFESITVFSEQMREVRRLLELIGKLYYHYQKEAWYLHAADVYCNAIKELTENLSSITLSSRGFLALREFLINYSAGIKFKSLAGEVTSLKSELANVKYRLIINENSFTVQNYEPGIDYSTEIETTFDKFKQTEVKDYLVKYDYNVTDMNHIEAKILDFVAKLNSPLFTRLDNFCNKYDKLSGLLNDKQKVREDWPAVQADFIDETIAVFEREVHFYIAYLKHIEKFKNRDLKFCYPHIIGSLKEVYDYQGFDLALAKKLTDDNKQIICNDFYLKNKERIIVVTGPNQGGKTTFARTFGQLHYLAAIGCRVPGSKAQMFLFDHIFTQFERAEKVENQRGKLEDDLMRIHEILEHATPHSIIILNEIFSSTTLQDVTFLSKKILDTIKKLDLLCVWVTFIDELAAAGEQVVSMISTVEPENPALRTFKIIRQPANGLAYAFAIAEKYNLTYCRIMERIKK